MRFNLLKQLTSILTVNPPRASLSVLIALLSFSSLQASAITGGSSVKPNTSVALRTVGIFNVKTANACSGTLIAKDVVLTAGHCVISKKENLIVIFDTHFPNKVGETDKIDPRNIRTIRAMAFHDDFKNLDEAGSDYGDIGIIKLTSPAPENYLITPLLKDVSNIRPSDTVTLAGFGYSSEKTIVTDRNYPGVDAAVSEGRGYCNNYKTKCYVTEVNGDGELREVQVTIETLRDKDMVLNESNQKATCSGDSGGPAFVEINGKTLLAGVTSRTLTDNDCGSAQGVKTLVPHYFTWIKQMIQAM
ncbi:trypsin-like serine protease [Bdellovibrio sp. ZAP7]|uniref:S1 family peptidase n=1 Tax=Bdellovibrio sp. ZAP7 TaxID=2231053 RepID=UPI00143CE486|nr:trypsin-like serine protease [Bdellovibrio sp. ZAP7]